MALTDTAIRKARPGEKPYKLADEKGVSAPGLTPTLLDLDVSLTNCNYPGMNRRFSGSLHLNASAKTAQLGLQGPTAPR